MGSNNAFNILGKKKHSMQVFSKADSHQNKENIRPASSNKFANPKKSFNIVGASLDRPE